MSAPTSGLGKAASGAWEQAVDQWRLSPLLRLGALAIVALAGLQLYWMWGDRLAAVQEAARSERELAEQQRGQVRAGQWERLGPELKSRLDSLEAGMWPGDDPALVQAGLQDWFRSSARAAGVVVRELSVSRQMALGAPAPTAEPDLPGSPVALARRVGSGVDVEALERDGVAVWQVRAKLEFERASALAFLGTLASHPQWLVTSSMQLELQRSPPLLSLELRALSRLAPRKP